MTPSPNGPDPAGPDPVRPAQVRPAQVRPAPTRPALLLAAHGTRDQAGVAAFNALAERVGDLAGRDGTRVAGGFIELSPPPLREAVAALVRRLTGEHGGGAADAVRGRARQGRHPRGPGPRAHPASGPAVDLRPPPRSASRAARTAGRENRGGQRPRRRSGGARGRPRLHRPGRQRGRGQDHPAAVGGPGLPARGDRLRLAGPARRPRGPGAVPPARRAADRGGQVLPVSRACCPTGWPSRPASTPPRIPNWTSGAPTCSATATRSPRWSTSDTTRRCQETSG